MNLSWLTPFDVRVSFSSWKNMFSTEISSKLHFFKNRIKPKEWASLVALNAFFKQSEVGVFCRVDRRAASGNSRGSGEQHAHRLREERARADLIRRPASLRAEPQAFGLSAVLLREGIFSEFSIFMNFPDLTKFEGIVVGCIEADFCEYMFIV